MKKQIKQMIKKLKDHKTFLENKITWTINDLVFYDHFNYLDERQKTIDYLDMTWLEYDGLNKKIKELKKDLKGCK
jgi:hypothetical protein